MVTKMSDDPVLVTMGVIGTLFVIALTIHLTGLMDPNTRFDFRKDTIPVCLIIAVMFCVWWSVPFAWLRGLLFDPVFCIIGAMIMAFAVISGCIESDSAYKKRRNRP